jgi:hypothetical protein
LASNFRIISYNFEGSLYLKLTGDFDEGAAHKLINTLKKNDKGSGDIFIDTNNLKTIHPFDRDVFQKNLNNIKKQLKKLIIIGVNKYKIEQDLE